MLPPAVLNPGGSRDGGAPVVEPPEGEAHAAVLGLALPVAGGRGGGGLPLHPRHDGATLPLPAGQLLTQV